MNQVTEMFTKGAFVLKLNNNKGNNCHVLYHKKLRHLLGQIENSIMKLGSS